ncbi:MAG: hypothetical protein ACREVM_10330 [Burkholderiales bacterium]
MQGKAGGRPVLLACGSDVRGLVYAVLELADLPALDIRSPMVERPANAVRSVARCFVSEVEDKPWYNDRSMWPPYLSMLAAQRFNRFSLTFGIGYDFTRNIRNCYFHFAYPFLLSPHALCERTRDRRALEEALKSYRAARAAWADLAGRAKDVYIPDITFGFDKHLRGHWLDRLPAIDDDLADMEKRWSRQGRRGGAASETGRSRSAGSAAASRRSLPAHTRPLLSTGATASLDFHGASVT